MSDRLAQLERLLSRQPDDPFLRYGIAMEHKKAGRWDEALDWLDRTLAADARYPYAHYQKGQVYEATGNAASARHAYQQGLESARLANDPHAASEIEAALEMLE